MEDAGYIMHHNAFSILTLRLLAPKNLNPKILYPVSDIPYPV
jgi:hypothetical protein